MPASMRAFALLLATLLLTSLLACSASRTAPLASGHWTPLTAGPAIPFPPDRQLASTTFTQNGTDATAHSSHCSPIGVTLDMLAGANQSEFATYQFLPGTPPSSIAVTVDGPNTTEYWVAAGDYGSAKWRFAGPFTTSQTIPAFVTTSVGPFGSCAVAIVVAPGMKARVVTIAITANSPPVAMITTSPNNSPPYLATLDATGSTDSDGTIVKYEWDLDNDGTYETDTGGTPASELQINAPGDYTVGLRVTDDLGAKGTATAVVLGFGWKTITVSTDQDSGNPCWLADINGKPAIAYLYTDTAGLGTRELRYAYASTLTGTNPADWNVITIPSQISGGSLCLANVNGNPAISYYGDLELKYARSTTALGGNGGDWVGATPDGTNVNIGTRSSLAMIAGHPAIAYYGSNNDAYYVWSVTTDGVNSADWGTPVFIDGAAGNSGLDVSLAEVNGAPAIAYRDEQAGTHVKYARANSTTGATAGAWTDPGSSKFLLDGGSGLFPSLAIVSGHPAVAMWDGSDLIYSYSSTLDGALPGDWSLIAADGGPEPAGSMPRLAVLNGKPAILHNSGTDPNTILFTQASTPTGSQALDWPSDSMQVVSTGNPGASPSLAVIDGFAAVAFYEGGLNMDLKYAILFQ